MVRYNASGREDGISTVEKVWGRCKNGKRGLIPNWSGRIECTEKVSK